MRSLYLVSNLTLLTLLLASCQNDQKGQGEVSSEFSPEIKESYMSKGNAASEALMNSLSTQLKAAMKNGGVLAAVDVCKQVAQPSTEAISTGLDGLTVSRTSLNVRNPENAPDDLDLGVLQTWQDLDDQSKPIQPKMFSVDGQTVRFYKPIYTKELCVLCHGPSDALEPKLLTMLDELYPEDKARGYKVGDLRGAFKVEMNLNKLDPAEPSIHK